MSGPFLRVDSRKAYRRSVRHVNWERRASRREGDRPGGTADVRAARATSAAIRA